MSLLSVCKSQGSVETHLSFEFYIGGKLIDFVNEYAHLCHSVQTVRTMSSDGHGN